MKPVVFRDLLEKEYDLSSDKRIANILNLGAIIMVVGILMGAIWKVRTGKLNKSRQNQDDGMNYDTTIEPKGYMV